MTETLIERWLKKPHFTCPKCHRTSWNPSDIGNQYCGACHEFFGQKRDYVRNRPPSYGEYAERPQPARSRDDDSVVSFPTFPTPSWDPPDPPSFEPGGGSSGGGGASGDY